MRVSTGLGPAHTGTGLSTKTPDALFRAGCTYGLDGLADHRKANTMAVHCPLLLSNTHALCLYGYLLL